MEKDRIMCEAVQKAPEAGDPTPGNSPLSELLLGIALQRAYDLGHRLIVYDGAVYSLAR